MKTATRTIYGFQEDDFFFPLRDKVDYLKLLMFAARSLLLNTKIDNVEVNAKLKLIVDKMSRMFFYKKDKFFSVSFPFTVIVEDDEVVGITSYTGKIVDSMSISAVLSILSAPNFSINPSLIDFYIEPGGIEASGIFLLEELFQFEPGYIRYDVDQDRLNGRIHPVHHVDVNYSQYGTFKLGLDAAIDDIFFENMQDIRTDCVFLQINMSL